MNRDLRAWAISAVFLSCVAAAFAGQQEPTTSAGDAPAASPARSAGDNLPGLDSGALTIGPRRIMDMFVTGSLIHIVTMWALFGSSVLTLAIVLERIIVLRESRVIPKTFVERFLDRLRDGELDRAKALELCRDNGSPFANILAIVVQHWGRPAQEIRQAVSAGADTELFYLRRRIRGLNGMATLAPLMGLFGTVVGMIEAFAALAQHTGAGKTELLAAGISLALMATAAGLIIAIVSAASYYFLLGRLDRLIQGIDVLANEVILHVAAEARAPDKATTRPRVLTPPREQASV